MHRERPLNAVARTASLGREVPTPRLRQAAGTRRRAVPGWSRPPLAHPVASMPRHSGFVAHHTATAGSPLERGISVRGVRLGHAQRDDGRAVPRTSPAHCSRSSGGPRAPCLSGSAGRGRLRATQDNRRDPTRFQTPCLAISAGDPAWDVCPRHGDELGDRPAPFADQHFLTRLPRRNAHSGTLSASIPSPWSSKASCGQET
jgi:hypothetical protein